MRPLAGDSLPDAFSKGWRLLTLDGFNLAIPDSPDNACLFGRHANQHGASGYPAVRVVVLREAATRATLDYELGAGTASETVLAADLLPRLPAAGLLWWDRHFFCFDHLWRVRQRGSHVLGRSRFGVRGRLQIRLLPYRLADRERCGCS